jgi:hypothetical protein
MVSLFGNLFGDLNKKTTSLFDETYRKDALPQPATDSAPDTGKTDSAPDTGKKEKKEKKKDREKPIEKEEKVKKIEKEKKIKKTDKTEETEETTMEKRPRHESEMDMKIKKTDKTTTEKRPRHEQDAVRIEPEEAVDVPKTKSKKAKFNDDEDSNVIEAKVRRNTCYVAGQCCYRSHCACY